MSTAKSLQRQAALLAVVAASFVAFFFGAYHWASIYRAPAYDGNCHWLGEYSSPCTMAEYLNHEATSLFFPYLRFPQALMYLVYFGIAVWLLRFLFELFGFVVRAAQQRAPAER